MKQRSKLCERTYVILQRHVTRRFVIRPQVTLSSKVTFSRSLCKWSTIVLVALGSRNASLALYSNCVNSWTMCCDVGLWFEASTATRHSTGTVSPTSSLERTSGIKLYPKWITLRALSQHETCRQTVARRHLLDRRLENGRLILAVYQNRNEILKRERYN